MPLLGGQVAWMLGLRCACRRSFGAHVARVMPARARSPQQDCGRQREQHFYSLSYYLTFDDTITISQGVRYARLRGCTRQHHHIPTLLSRPDALHTLPLSTMLALCRVLRRWFSTTNLMGQLFAERAQRGHEQAARGEREGFSLVGGACKSRAYARREGERADSMM